MTVRFCREKNISFQQPSPGKKYKIAYFKEAVQHPSLDTEIKENILSLIDTLKKEGHSVTEIGFDLLEYVVPTYYILTTAPKQVVTLPGMMEYAMVIKPMNTFQI